MIEAPLLGDKLLDRNAPLAALARVPGVDDVAVDDNVTEHRARERHVFDRVG